MLRLHSLIGHAMVAMDWAQASPSIRLSVLWIQGSQSEGKHQSSDHGRTLVLFHQGIYHPQPTQIPPPTATKNSPGEKCYYEKECLLCDSHCFIKKIFFFSKQNFSRRIQRFSKATPNTEQLIILFLKGLLLQRKSLYLKILETLRFTMLLCCTCLWAERGGRKWIN